MEGVEQLSAACEPATFGKNAEAVLDETYRKALVLNNDRFSINFCPERTELDSVVYDGLVATEDEDRAINFELYKLNIYCMSLQSPQ